MANKASSGLYKDKHSYVYYTDRNGCKGRYFGFSAEEIEGHIYFDRPSFAYDFSKIAFFGSLAALLSAGLIYGLCWSLGWVAAGFTPDRDTGPSWHKER